MASPTGSGARSPPGPSPLALPKQRLSLALPKSRKPSIASTTSSAHPLRQTSFPPESLEAQHAAAEDAELTRQFSPSQASQGSLEDEFSDSEIASAISVPAVGQDGISRKRKRGEKRPKGRPPKQAGFRAGSASLVNGEEGGGGTPAGGRRDGTAGAPSVVTADNADDEDDNEDDDDVGGAGGRAPLYEGGQMSPEEYAHDNIRKSNFRQYMDAVDSLPFTDPERRGMTVRDMGERYDVWNRAKLRTADVRRLVNQTLSQSVPANVVTVVNSYTKMFAGLLIEEAREVQAEWMAVAKERADGEENPILKKLKQSQTPTGDGQEAKEEDNAHPKSSESSGNMKQDDNSSPTQPDTQTNGHSTSSTDDVYPGGAGGLSTLIEECDRGPLLPDHLREALRRYKKARQGGTVGFTGISLEGRDTAASRMGGRRLFT